MEYSDIDELFPEMPTSDILGEIANELDCSETCGPTIHAILSDIINNHFSTGLAFDKAKTKQDKYRTPNNCTTLHVPQLGKVIKDMSK
jgi:hypothetical protein